MTYEYLICIIYAIQNLSVGGCSRGSSVSCVCCVVVVCLMYCSHFGLVCQLEAEPASVPEVSPGSAWHPRSHNTAGRGCCRWCQLTAASEREQSAACINTEYGRQLPVSHHGVTLRDQRGTWLIMNASNITDSANMTSGPPGTVDMDKALYRTLAQVSVRIISFVTTDQQISSGDRHLMMSHKYAVNVAGV